jgi:Chromo (CHRromatin Organisation MOdifier) domain
MATLTITLPPTPNHIPVFFYGEQTHCYLLPKEENIKPYFSDETAINCTSRSRREVIMKAMNEIDEPWITLEQLKKLSKVTDEDAEMSSAESEPETPSQYEVERIVKSQVIDVNDLNSKGETMYYIKWKNFPSTVNTWEPKHHLSEQLLADFHNKLKRKTERTVLMSSKIKIEPNDRETVMPKRIRHLDTLPTSECEPNHASETRSSVSEESEDTALGSLDERNYKLELLKERNLQAFKLKELEVSQINPRRSKS